MMEFIRLNYKEIWAITATLFLGLSEMLGWSKKFKSSSIMEFLYLAVKKSVEKPPVTEAPVETRAEKKVEEIEKTGA